MTTTTTEDVVGQAMVKHEQKDMSMGMTFPDMVHMGDELVRTGFLPMHIKTGAQFAAIVMSGRELGMQPMRAVRSLTMVKGKVIENADSQLARFKSSGGRAAFKTLTPTEAVLVLRHPNGDEHQETFTIADAKRAGLEGDNWRKFPQAMLRSRAITAGLKSIGWEGAVGTYDPDEAMRFDGAQPSHDAVTGEVPAQEIAMDFLADISKIKTDDDCEAIRVKIKESPLKGGTLDQVVSAWKQQKRKFVTTLPKSEAKPVEVIDPEVKIAGLHTTVDGKAVTITAKN